MFERTHRRCVGCDRFRFGRRVPSCDIRAMANDNEQTSATSAVWTNHVTVPETPKGFTVRTTVPANANGVEVMLEQWEAGSAEPPHSHPGDDMTVVVEGKMAIQFYFEEGGALVPD